MKTKQLLKLQIEKLQAEITAHEKENMAAVQASNWSAVAVLRSQIDLAYGQIVGMNLALFYIDFHAEIA